ARFKREIVAEIVKAVSPDAAYSPDQFIPEGTLDASGIFTKAGTLRGDDLFRGRIGRTPFEAWELNRSYTEGSGDNERTRTVFHGLFFHLDFNKTLHGRTIVEPRDAESWRLGSRAGLSAVALEDPAFEKVFAVHSTSQVEARYVLTPALMERIVELRPKTGKPIFLAFGANAAVVACGY